ncbi:SDR family oxidoreductase [bacterium]|nr:SDR family oxidoreductase [bacterium]
MKKTDLKGKVAIVSGASRGIGKAIAMALAAEGIAVMATARSGKQLTELVTDIEHSGGTGVYVVQDLADPGAPAMLVDRTLHTFGRLDILVNNAGCMVVKSIQETSLAEWEQVMAINARAPFLLSQAACPHMAAVGGGTIIQIVSVAGVTSYPDQGAYTAAKHALMGFSKVLAQEVQKDQIRVHTILPGGVDTDMIGQVRPDLTPSELISPADIAEVVIFLLTHRSCAVIDSVRMRRAVSDPWF